MPASVRDYVNRTVDMLLYDSPTEPFTQQAVQMLPGLVQPGQSGALTTGIQKLAQRFILELLTVRGSLRYLPDRGTSFLAELRSGQLRTASDVIDAFARAEHYIRGQLRREQSETDPADERYRMAELLNATHNGDRISLRVRVVSDAGEEATIIYPLRINSV